MTIQEIAKLAGVSVATVSRVFSGANNVSEKSREKVLSVAKSYNYEPNLLGRHLRTKETKIILVLLTTIANDFCSKVVRGINREAMKNGYNIMICATNDDLETEKSYLKLVKNRMADGAIIMNTCMSDEEINSLGERYNIIQCSEYSCVNNVPYISIDNKQAGYDAVSHLLSLGRRRIAYLGVKNHFTSSHLRFDGYIAALRENGIEEDRDIIFDGNYGYNSSIKLTDEFLEKKVKFDAMFAISDRMAAGAITSMKNHGLKVPEDIAVVGFDNTSISYIYEPNITTVAQPQNELGEKAFQMMYDKIKKNEPKNIFLTHKIIVRKSTQI